MRVLAPSLSLCMIGCGSLIGITRPDGSTDADGMDNWHDGLSGDTAFGDPHRGDDGGTGGEPDGPASGDAFVPADPDRPATCDEHADCLGWWCVCTNVVCASGRCSPTGCPCQYDGETDGVCDGALVGGVDPFDDCPYAHICSHWEANGGGPFYWGISDQTSDGTPNPLCYLRANVIEPGCSQGICISRENACSSSGRGIPDPDKPICFLPESGCVGFDPPAYVAVIDGPDPYNECPGTCQAGQCALQAGDPCDGIGTCEDGLFCVDDVCCISSSCGTCERCDEPSYAGTCHGITTDNAPGCTDDCSHCVAGNCEARDAGDATECDTVCTACLGSGSDCGDWTGATDHWSCSSSATQYCCNGRCSYGAGPWGEPCGGGDCAGGINTCYEQAAICSTWQQPCATCTGDSYINGSCNQSGSYHCIAAWVECPPCTSCRDDGASHACVAIGGTNSYPAGVQDSNGAERCVSPLVCDGNGNCL
ncbi:hypothetical protein ACFL6C_10370 [Myxococcota bacterium]